MYRGESSSIDDEEDDDIVQIDEKHDGTQTSKDTQPPVISPIHDPLHPFIRILVPEQCPDTGVAASRLRTNPYGIVIVGSIGVPHGSTVQVGERFFAGWKVMNQSDRPWSAGWRLRFVKGDDLRIDRRDILIQSQVLPGKDVEVLMEMSADSTHSARVCRGFYRLSTPDNTLAGPPMEYEVRVAPLAASELPTEEQRQKQALDTLKGMGFSDTAKILPLLKAGKEVRQIVEILLR